MQCSGIRDVQNLPQPRYRAQQRREPSLLCYLQLLRVQAIGDGHQNGFQCPGRKAEENGEVDEKSKRAQPVRCLESCIAAGPQAVSVYSYGSRALVSKGTDTQTSQLLELERYVVWSSVSTGLVCWLLSLMIRAYGVNERLAHACRCSIVCGV